MLYHENVRTDGYDTAADHVRPVNPRKAYISYTRRNESRDIFGGECREGDRGWREDLSEGLFICACHVSIGSDLCKEASRVAERG